MLIYAKAPLFLWAEAVATACYTKNCSMIRHCHGKTPYKLLHDKPPDLSYLHVFGALCYPTNDCENLGKLQPKADIGIFIGYAPTTKAFRIYNRRTRRIIETIYVDFDELTAMASKHSSSGPTLHDMTPVTIITTVDQDAPSPSNSHTTQETQTPIISHDVEEDNHDIEVAHMGNDPYFGILIPEVTSDQSSSSDVIHSIVPLDHQVSAHNCKWTKDHPLKNIIGDLLSLRFHSMHIRILSSKGFLCHLIHVYLHIFDVLVGMDLLSKRKFGIVCHEKVVRIPLEGDEILQVYGERTQGVMKTLMNTKVGE
ncbi:integrase, catalytic region, zinc finger, CCHC-type containing protein [Tanacetum coccineum]